MNKKHGYLDIATGNSNIRLIPWGGKQTIHEGD
jgi:hypothetical protein